MYQQESKERQEEELEENEEDQEPKNSINDKSTESNNNESNFTAVRTTSQTPTTTAQSAATKPDADVAAATGHRLRSSDINAYESDPSSLLLPTTSYSNAAAVSSYGGSAAFSAVATCQQGVGGFDEADMDGVNVIRFGTNPTGDVSLTLGLRHAGNNIPDKDPSFCVREFGGF